MKRTLTIVWMSRERKERVYKLTYRALESLNTYLVLQRDWQAVERSYDFASVLQDGVEFGRSCEGTLNENLGQAIHL